jgi:hypothetical protein
MLYTTDEAVKITKIPRATWNRYVEKRWLEPEKIGGGRGKQSEFNRWALGWAMGLRETFNLYPRANINVYLFDKTKDKTPQQWSKPLKLKGEPIQNFIQNWWEHGWEPLAIRLNCCYIGVAATLTTKRFAEILIGPMAKTRLLLKNWEERSVVPYTTSDRGPQFGTIASVAVINLDQLLRRVDMRV